VLAATKAMVVVMKSFAQPIQMSDIPGLVQLNAFLQLGVFPDGGSCFAHKAAWKKYW